MDKLFIAILNNTLVASWIIFAVIVLRFVFKKFIKKIPKWVNCLLWGLVAIRLVFPFSIESIFSLIPSAKPVPVDIEYAKVPKINSGINVVNTAINPILENNFVAKEIASVNPIQIVIIVASYLWIIGVIGLLVYAIISFLMLKSRVRNSQLIDKGIFQSENIDSPFILGLLRPCVYIPDSLEEEAYQCVIEHELAHIKRGDFIWKPMGFLILSVYWFNPLCWIAYICLCRDIEYACDEKVTRDKDKDWKALYCQVLLDCSSERRLISACPVAFGEVSVKDRIKSVINYKRPSFWIVCISIIVAIIVAICFLTNPKQKEIDRDSIVGKYVNDIAEEDKMLYASVISINEDGTFGFTPSLISSYMGAGIWEIDKDHIIFYDTGMGDTRKEVFQYNDGVLYYLASESASNSMWQLADGTQYTLAPEDYDLIKDALETNEDQNIADSGIGMPNSAILGQNDVRFYAKAQDLSNEKNGIVLSITSIEDGIVTVKVQNNTDNDFEYGEYYSLQKEVDGQWYTLPVKLSNFGFTDIGIILGAGESREEKCDISIYGGLQAGHYKLEKEGMATDFFVESDNSMHANVDSECECAELEIPALIKVNGLLYYDSAEISTEGRCGMMDGVIDSVCEGDFPAEDNQSNFGKGYYYQYWPDTIQVNIDDEWHIFKKFDYDEWYILPEYVYCGDDPIENAITNYVLANNYHYEMKASVAIPAFCIFMSEVDENDADIIKVYGNYWLFIYEKVESTLECISGVEAPGVMYVKKNGDQYVVDHFEQVRDGAYYTDDIKTICGGNKSLEDQFFGSSDAMSTSRAYTIKKYVEMFDLEIDSYHDYGWDKVMLAEYSFDGSEEKE